MNHTFCKLLLNGLEWPKNVGVTFTKIGGKKYFTVQYLRKMLWHGEAHCVANAKYKAFKEWKAVKRGEL